MKERGFTQARAREAKGKPADRMADGLRWSCERLGCDLLISRADAGYAAVDVVVAVPREVAVVVVMSNIWQVGIDDLLPAIRGINLDRDAIAARLPEADDREGFPPAVHAVEHPHLVADLKLACRDLYRVQELAEAKLFGHGSVEAAEHVVELVPVLLLGWPERAHPDGVPIRIVLRPQVLCDAPPLDDVDTVVAGVHLPISGVGADTEREGASEEVAHHLADAGEAVLVRARRPIALQFAVLEQRLDGVAPSVPVQVDADLALGRGDDGSISHDDLLMFAAPLLSGRLLGSATAREGVRVQGGKRKPQA